MSDRSRSSLSKPARANETIKLILSSAHLGIALPFRFAALVFLSCLIEIVLTKSLKYLMPNIGGALSLVFDAFVLSLAICIFTFLLIVRPLIRALMKEQAVAEEQTKKLQGEMARQQFDTALRRAMEMAENESDVLRVVQRTLWQIGKDNAMALLLADSSQAHLRQVKVYCPDRITKAEPLSVGAAAAAPADAAADACGHRAICTVDVPRQCVASRQGRMLHFGDSEALDACPFIVTPGNVPVNVACMPVSIVGRTVGVLHAGAPRERQIDDSLRYKLESVATKLGTRLGMIRAMSASELAATTDSLTGLLNRRSLEDKVGRLAMQGRSFSVVLADLDNFKQLNDTYGHVVGDQALKMFARALKENCHSDDIVARYGGEEFVVVFPDLISEKAVSILDRLRSMLPDLQMRGGLPPFTVSFGVADTRHEATFEGILHVADGAMYKAKMEGRDRIIVAGLLKRNDAPVREVSE
ncbi:MAG: GGDEF domain-containing protein [Syntrophaceae bacterium]